MSQMQNFKHHLFGELPVIIVEGAEWFGAKQVAKALGYSNPHDALVKHCRREGVAFHEVLTKGGIQQMKFINEGNLYRLITKSKLPVAEKFEGWVFDEILPTIRKHGAYLTPETIERTLSDPDFIIGLATKLKEEQQKTARLREQIEMDKPKVVFADAVTTSKTSILVGELAKILKQNGVCIGQNRLFGWLRDNGYLIKRKGTDYNMPTQKSMELGLFEIKETSVTHSDGHITISKTPKVTGKGQLYFVNKFKESA